MTSIGIRELRQNASKHVRAAAAGATVTITDRGEPVAKLTRLSPVDRRLWAVLETHVLIPPTLPRAAFGDDLPPPGPALSPLLAEDRAERLA
jgi:prevent-host-death family protein